MNLCIITGKIINKPIYKLMIEKNKYSVISMKIKIDGKSIIKAKAYNEIADEIYKTCNIENNILIEGYLKNNIEIIINKIKLF